jgi:hypothetical protein
MLHKIALCVIPYGISCGKSALVFLFSHK